MRFRIAEAVPLEGSIAFSNLACKVNLDEAFLTRILRHAFNYHVLTESSPGHVAHTVSSALLRSGGSVRDWLDMTLEEWGPASVKALDALQKFPHSQEPRETGFGLAFDGQTIFEFLSQRPERARVFGSAMGNFSKGISHKVEHLVQNYPWENLGDGTVVDVCPLPLTLNAQQASRSIRLTSLSTSPDRGFTRAHLPRHRPSRPQASLHRTRSPQRCRQRRTPPPLLLIRRCRLSNLLPSPRHEKQKTDARRGAVPLSLRAPQLARRLRGPVFAEPHPRADARRAGADQRGGAATSGGAGPVGREDHPQLGPVHDGHV